jgi:hypothetical protein
LIERKALLICGILSSLLYIGTDIHVAMQLNGYRHLSSRQRADGYRAPTRPELVIDIQYVFKEVYHEDCSYFVLINR